MRKKAGFTLTEIIIAIAISIILAGFLVKGLTASYQNSILEERSMRIIADLRGLRPLAIKNDCKVFAKFDSSRFCIYVDRNRNDSCEASELLRIDSLKKPVKFGVPSTKPNSVPPGADKNLTNLSVAEGLWKTKGLMINRDAIGSVNNGVVYISSKRVKEICYGIMADSLSQGIKIFRWNGKNWKVL